MTYYPPRPRSGQATIRSARALDLALERASISIRQLALKVGTSRQTIGELRNGVRTCTSATTASRVEHELGLRLGDLFLYPRTAEAAA